METYVSQWDSSTYFLPAFTALLISKIAQASDNDPWATVLQAYAFLSSRSSAKLAEQAVSDIVQDLEASYLPDPADTSVPQPQIHLIGHSRGAAVSAGISQVLSQHGYTVDQLTVLDGFSTDWPDDGALIGDISIVDVATAERKVNYRVEKDLANFVVNLLEGIIPDTDDLIASLNAVTALKAGLAYGAVNLLLDPQTRRQDAAV